jgi:hypothetical protein
MSDLLKISKKYRTDKVQNGYIPHYEEFFESLRNKKLNILEIGVKRATDYRKYGMDIVTPGACSLKTWKEYFPNSNIYGIDIDPENKKYEEDRIEIFIGNQADQNFLSSVTEKVGNFDIIIDDGSHVNKFTIASYNALWPFLNGGGLYIIEDVGCGYINLDEQDVREKSKINKYWFGMHLLPENISYKNNRGDFLNFIQEKLTRMDLGSSQRWRSKFNLEEPDVYNISFYNNMCFITKVMEKQK